MQESLFRPEVTSSRHDQLCGELLVTQPLPLRLMTGLLAGAAVTAVFFLATHTYTRKQTVNGWLEPDTGLTEITVQQTGLVADVFVAEGQAVSAGQVLFKVVTDNRHNGGEAVSTSLVTALEMQLQLLAESAVQEQAGLAREEHRLAGDMLELRQGLLSEQATLEAEQQVLGLQASALERATTLTDRGLLSRADLESVQLRHASQAAAVGRQQSRVLAAMQAMTRREQEASSLHDETVLTLQKLGRERAELEGRLQQLQASTVTEVVAPIRGLVDRVMVHPGQFGGSDTVALSLVPEDTRLQARLQVPSEAIGFVRAGQQVNLRYSAYAYQKFGVHQGTVDQVSTSPMASATEGGQPFYQVIVSLQTQDMRAYGEDVPLRPGLGLTADIVLDHRSLLEWLLEPLYSLGRGL